MPLSAQSADKCVISWYRLPPSGWAPPPSTIWTGRWSGPTWSTRSPSPRATSRGSCKSIAKTAATLVSVPMFMAADFYNRRLFNDLFFVRYKGESEDRLRCLAEELFDTVLRPSIFPGAYELIDKSRQLGLRQVLVTGALDITVRPLAKHLKIDDYVTNRLEFVDGYATGRLLPPVMAAATKASWMRIYAEKENLNLSDCYGYSDSMSDLPMLSVVGHPTAVNPDIRLRNTALQHDWPILDLR